jgi:hypothetical protein
MEAIIKTKNANRSTIAHIGKSPEEEYSYLYSIKVVLMNNNVNQKFNQPERFFNSFNSNPHPVNN